MKNDPNPQHTANDGAPGTGDGVSTTDDDSDLLLDLQQKFRSARDHLKAWRDEARECYDFVAGHQWSEDDATLLADQQRPVITFNLVGPFVDGVCGLEITNRQETRYIPRTLTQLEAGVAELLTNAAKWVRDESDSEDEESSAFRDALICGMGWVHTRMDYDEDPDGAIKIDRVDPLEMYGDPSASKDNVSDGRYLFRVKDMPIAVARMLCPDADDEDLHAQWAEDEDGSDKAPSDAQEAPFYRAPGEAGDDYSGDDAVVRMVEAEWYDTEASWRLHIPGQPVLHLNAKDHSDIQDKAKKAGLGRLRSVKDKKRRYHRALIGNIVLTNTPGPDMGGFSYKAMTGKRDRNARTWFGLIRAMRDPQMWANKWLAQILHILNSNAKGGLLAEEDAFANVEKAADDWADPQAIVWMNPGGLDKVKERQPGEWPMGIDNLLQFAVASLPKVTGVSMEMLGQVDHEQSGILEMHRTQRGMSVLAQFFDSKRRYQKEQGRLMLWMIQTFISDGRLIRIGGADDAQFVPLVRDKDLLRYDVVVDDTPWSPNQKERTFGILLQMMPFLKELPPQAMIEMLKYSPLPETMITKIAAMVQQAQSQQAPPPPPSAREQAQIAVDQAKVQLHQATIAKMGAETNRIGAETGVTVDQKTAQIELLRAQAIAAMAQVGLDTNDARLGAARDAVDSLMNAQDQMHGQAMDQHGALLAQQDQQLAAQKQAHDQAMAQQQQAMAAQGQQHGQQMAEQAAQTAQTAAQQPSGNG